MPTPTLPQDDSAQMDLRRKFEHLGIDCSEGLEEAERSFREKYRYPSGDLWQKLDELAGSTFGEVFQFELDALTAQLPERTKPAELAQVIRRAHGSRLAGLAFSGGGIRSATFNLGIIQALAEMKLLRDFDYLSTVSGGGYIGGWLSKWISQEGGHVTRVEQAFESSVPRAPSPAPPQQPHGEPRAVQFLRRYSNYLTPKTGMFSADTWTLIFTYLRNTLLNMTILLTLLAALFLLPRLVMQAIMPALSADVTYLQVLAVVLFLWTVALIAFSISRNCGRRWNRGLMQTQGAVLRWICLPLVLSGIFGSIGVWQIRKQITTFWHELPESLLDPAYGWFLLPGLAYFVAWAAGWACAQYANRRDAARGGPDAGVATPVPWWAVGLQGLEHLVCAATALAVGSVLLLKGVSLIVDATTSKEMNGVHLATFGMPAMLCQFGITTTLMIGLVGRLYRDESREWWARLAAWTFILALSWFGLFAAAFYLPPLLGWAWAASSETTTASGVVASLLTLLGLKAGSGKSTGPNMTNMTKASKTRELAALVAPYAFSVLAIALLTTALQRAVMEDAEVPEPKQLWSNLDTYTGNSSAAAAPLGDAFWQCTGAALEAKSVAGLRSVNDACSMSTDLKLFLTCIAIGMVLAWRVDINKFSLYMMYRLRLVRAYLGATTPHRAPHPFTGFDPQDDPPLSSLLRRQQPEAGGAPVQRPYHLLNAAVNLVGGKELAWQTRKAANFVFSPGFCGFELPRMPDDRSRCQLRGAFRPTAQYASEASALRDNDAVIKLGTAVAVSGAAASPNMGYHTSAPLSFLMTLFNLRLGRWSPNPMHEKVWRRPAPRIGLFSIFSELLGLTEADARFLYLSDGGHFENLGLYELVRRRCRLIVVVDSSADRPQAFADLGNAVRKCLTDFNIPIELNVRQIRSFGADTPEGVSFVTGKVCYSQVDGSDAHSKPYPDGVLLYIKPTIVGRENAGVLNYSKLHPEFPHESTADQWFDESQFESYRILGYEAGRAALAAIAAKLPGNLPPGDKARIKAICGLLAKPSAGAAAGPRSGAVPASAVPSAGARTAACCLRESSACANRCPRQRGRSLSCTNASCSQVFDTFLQK